MIRLQSHLQIGKQIGAGFFGQVYLASDRVHGEVAVKVLTQHSAETPAEWQARKAGLLQEGQHLSQATHRNVVQVHHALESENSDAVLLVMEYCRGGSLQSQCENGPMQLQKVVRAATDVCLGLEALHARGMLHRDIKPGNLLQDTVGRTKLGDFGLVTDATILGYGSQVGYMDHIAPEVWAGAGTSAKTDLWALGMTLYRLIHGASWYSSIAEPAAAIQAGGFANGLAWLPHVPKKWRTFLRKLLSDDPSRRFQSANQVATALATLPAIEGLECSVKPGLIEWWHTGQRRKTNVIWTRHSARRHEWRAWSEPLSSGNNRNLGGSNGIISKSDAVAQLEEFFTNFNP